MTRRPHLCVMALVASGLAAGPSAAQPAADAADALPAAAPVPELVDPAPAPFSFNRIHDAIVIQEATDLSGTRLERVGAFAVGDGGLAPIPFQIDERTPDGDFVFQAGAKAAEARSNGLLDPRDEIVFVSRDAGARLDDTAAWPAGASAGVEVEVEDPVSGELAWVYLFAFDGPAPRSDVDYVSYDREQELITSRSYSIQYTPGKDNIFFSDLIVPVSSGGSGRDFCDRLKLRTKVKTKFLLSLDFDEEEWNSEVVGYIDGPVRVIRQVENTLVFLGIIKVAPTIQVDATYYPAFHHAPARIQQTIDFQSVANEAWFAASIDLNEHAQGMRYYRPTPGQASPFHRVDGITSRDEEGLDPRRPPWHLVTGDPGTFIWRIRLPEPLREVTDLFYRDDRGEEGDPESTPGSIGEIGIKFDLFELPKGDYQAELFYMFPERWQPGDEAVYVAMIDEPLMVRLNGLTPPAATP